MVSDYAVIWFWRSRHRSHPTQLLVPQVPFRDSKLKSLARFDRQPALAVLHHLRANSETKEPVIETVPKNLIEHSERTIQLTTDLRLLHCAPPPPVVLAEPLLRLFLVPKR